MECDAFPVFVSNIFQISVNSNMGHQSCRISFPTNELSFFELRLRVNVSSSATNFGPKTLINCLHKSIYLCVKNEMIFYRGPFLIHFRLMQIAE